MPMTPDQIPNPRWVGPPTKSDVKSEIDPRVLMELLNPRLLSLDDIIRQQIQNMTQAPSDSDIEDLKFQNTDRNVGPDNQMEVDVEAPEAMKAYGVII